MVFTHIYLWLEHLKNKDQKNRIIERKNTLYGCTYINFLIGTTKLCKSDRYAPTTMAQIYGNALVWALIIINITAHGQ
jgi:hypothetical protein